MKERVEETRGAAARRFGQLPGLEQLNATIDVWVDADDQSSAGWASA